MKQHSFLIIHGLGGSGAEHWQTWLAGALRESGYHVSYPTFPDFDTPFLYDWLEELEFAVKSIPEGNQLTVVTHSLGCLLWSHYAAKQNERIAHQAILVAPPSPSKVIPVAKSFYPVPLNQYDLSKAAENTIFVHSSNDPYCSLEDAKAFINLGLPSKILPNAGHINIQSGHGKWQWILEKCLLTVEQAVTI
ncbi:RBBP9/YdeN family alpha/beta hydrolase [Bacillus sp. JJ1764]|uniref:RBBP9/YdeN family alpha/beta hydrolase n=1 Tax=Bacillus sp. JJ1764 TaxID=3122964 RepID=UPI002FFD8BDC